MNMNRWITSAIASCIRLLPTVLAGCPEGCNHSAYWGFLAQTCLCGSNNPLIGYGIFRLRGNTRTCTSINPVVHCRFLCFVRCETMFFLLDCRKGVMDGWTKGGIDVVCWSVPSFQHTIYPPKSPSLFPLPLFPLIPFSCCCCQYHLKWHVVAGDTLHQFLSDCPCLVGVKAKSKQQNDLHIIYGDI